MDTFSGLIGHWPLQQNANDHSGNQLHGQAIGLTFVEDSMPYDTRRVAAFDGRHSHVIIPHHDKLALGAGDFSFAAWFHTDERLNSALGDIASKYDPVQRRGINLGFIHNAGTTSSQPNFRNLHFGIDAAQIEPDWSECGRPGEAKLIFAFAVYQNDLYTGTFEIDQGQRGHVYRYLNDNQWQDCGCPDDSNSVMSLAVYNGDLFAATGCYNSCGSLLPPAKNQNPGGRIFRYRGGTDWEDCGHVCDKAACSLTVFDGRLFVSNLYGNGVFRYESGRDWVCVGLKHRVFAMTPYRGSLYGFTSGLDDIVRYVGGMEWESAGRIENIPQYYSGTVHQGKLAVGTWPESRVFNSTGDGAWTDIGRTDEEQEVMALGVYNGKLYAGSLPLAAMYRYDENAGWTNLGQIDPTPHVFYRRAWTLAVYRGRLFVGTLPAGRVVSIEAGRNATYDSEVSAGWHHICAVRDGGRLRLYLDGRSVAESGELRAKDYDLTVDTPWLIGKGQTDVLAGRLSDVRLYDRALNQQAVEALQLPAATIATG